MSRAAARAAPLLNPEEAVQMDATLGRSGDLREEDLPSTYGDWSEYARFAASHVPRSQDDAGELANWAFSRWQRTAELPGTLEELRSCLWFEYRRWRFHDRVPDAVTMRYCAALVRAMRAYV
jgi:hypothetical protein